jgi:hypothetical protein
VQPLRLFDLLLLFVLRQNSPVAREQPVVPILPVRLLLLQLPLLLGPIRAHVARALSQHAFRVKEVCVWVGVGAGLGLGRLF